MKRILLIALAWTLLVSVLPVSAQNLSREITDHCVHSAVKIVMLNDSGRGGSTGSGSMIDARGYVLTNFHVVGHMHPETGVPGTLHNQQNRVLLATVESARQAARPRWVGTVVRADAQLDLALIRIVSDTDGNRIQGAPFETISMASTEDLRPGSKVWAFGYPLGVRTINVTEGSIAGFQMNARDEVAWLRSDAEFNPGNSGGMLVDEQGRLVGVPTRVYHGRGRALEPVELARPVERVPASWLRELRAGHITDLQITGVGRLVAGSPARGYAAGDNGSVGSPDQHFYVLPNPPRPTRIRTQPGLPIALMHGNDVVRQATGEIELRADDPERLVLSLLVPRASERAVRYAIEMDAPAQAPANTTTTDVPNPFAPSGGSGGAFDAQQQRPIDAVTVRGTVIDGASSRALPQAWVLIGRPGANLAEQIRGFLAGRVSEQDLQRFLLASTRTDVQGRWSVTGVPPGRYPAAVLARDHRPSMANLTVGDSERIVDLPPVRLQR